MSVATPPLPLLNGRYQLLERVGSGGMAAVYRAQDLVLGRIVAVKLLHPSLTGDAVFLENFKREAHAAANLSHPNIVTVHDIGQDGDRHYIVMEFVEGQTLKQLIRQVGEGRPLPIHRALDLAVQICAGLGYAHRAGLVHCDMKPQNVLVARDDRVKVTDFGIARAVTEVTGRASELVWGTPQYFAPEQATGEAATPASDVYSVGVMLFEMLTGRLPFTADSAAALALKHLHEPPPAVSALNPAVPAALEEIVNKVLAKDPAARYRTAGQFGRILDTYRRQRPDGATPPPGPRVGETTQYHPHPAVIRPVTPGAPLTLRPAAEPETRPTAQIAPTQSGPDWISVTLGIVALIAWLGLIPLWIAVARLWNVL